LTKERVLSISEESKVDICGGTGLKTMKVLMVTDVFPNSIHPNLGTFSLERLKSLKKKSDVKVVAAVPFFPSWPFLKMFKRWHDFSRVPDHETTEGVDVYHPRRVVIPKIGGLTSGIFYRSMLVRKLKVIYREYPFDVIDAHFVWPDGYAALNAGNALNVPVCITAHGTDVNLMPSFAFIKPFIKQTLKGAARIVAVSQALADIALELGAPRDRVKVIHNGVDISKFKRIERAPAREELGLDGDDRILLSIGALIPRKAHEVLVQAMDILVNQNEIKNLKLLIIGEGESRKMLSDLIRGRSLDSHVRLIGSIPHGELYKWLSASDLFCLTSLREGWPTVFFESWACGIPVIATAVHGAPEAICSDKYGILIEKHDPALVADKIKQALARDWNPQDMMDYAAENTWDKMVEIMYAELEAIVEESKGSPVPSG
jgi:glycosyltransferase involved in cell wall biosynthesis